MVYSNNYHSTVPQHYPISQFRRLIKIKPRNLITCFVTIDPNRLDGNISQTLHKYKAILRLVLLPSSCSLINPEQSMTDRNRRVSSRLQQAC
jgi:hypothetical protein